jgi:L-rhamnono-1,4-lactonase
MSALPIIDSHIHLYAASHIPHLSWTGDLPQGHALNRQNSVEQYRQATRTHAPSLRGFIFLETDRKSGLQNTAWKDALEEISFLARIARDDPVPDEGHGEGDAKLLLGIVPWAPVPAGPEAVASYIAQARQRVGDDQWHLVKGFRYLVQDKPRGVMLDPRFQGGLQYLGEHSFTFDLGVDARSGGLHQLEEACEMMDTLYSSGSTVKIIVNHFCKPNLRLVAAEALEGHPDFVRWKRYIQRMAGHPHTYMKLSGLFSEFPEQEEGRPTEVSELVRRARPWVGAVFDVFTASRIMFGSDWPVCNVGGPGSMQSWDHWHCLVTAILDSRGLTREEKAQVWSNTAIEAYDIRLSS